MCYNTFKMKNASVLQRIFRKTSRISRVSFATVNKEDAIIRKGTAQIKKLREYGLGIPVALS